MNESRTHRFLARVTIEFTTPFHIGSGSGGIVSDAMVVADANGLPALPGSSLAGVLRSEFGKRHTADRTNEIFGSQDRSDGQGSPLSVSWGCIHDSNNRPVEGLAGSERLNDAVLLNALDSVKGEVYRRDHVRLGPRGAVEGRGKFEESYVCAGHRFSFELELAGSKADRETWEVLLGILCNGSLRIGGKTRRGFGAFRAVSVRTAEFDLSKTLTGYCEYPIRLVDDTAELVDWDKCSGGTEENSVFAELELEPEGYWMFGMGEDPVEMEHPADMASVRDTIIQWPGEDGPPRIVPDVLVIPGSAVKGAISHRVAFHYNSITGVFADLLEDRTDIEKPNHAVQQLFGSITNAENQDPDGGDSGGSRGRILIDDVFLSDGQYPSQRVPHVSLDRFTGGAKTLSGALFSERPLWKGDPITLRLTISERGGVEPDVWKALELTLDDLAGGRLQMGGGSGRGLGFFRAPKGVSWSDGGNWIREVSS